MLPKVIEDHPLVQEARSKANRAAEAKSKTKAELLAAQESVAQLGAEPVAFDEGKVSQRLATASARSEVLGDDALGREEAAIASERKVAAAAVKAYRDRRSAAVGALDAAQIAHMASRTVFNETSQNLTAVLSRVAEAELPAFVRQAQAAAEHLADLAQQLRSAINVRDYHSPLITPVSVRVGGLVRAFGPAVDVHGELRIER